MRDMPCGVSSSQQEYQHDNLEQRAAKQQREVAELKREVREATVEASQLRRSADSLTRELDAARSELAQATTGRQAAQAQVESLQHMVGKKDAVITQLETEVCVHVRRPCYIHSVCCAPVIPRIKHAQGMYDAGRGFVILSPLLHVLRVVIPR